MSAERERILEELLARQDAFRAFLVRRLGDASLADDVLQDVMLRSLRGVDSIRNPDAAVGWFYRALRNAVTDVHRRDGARRRKLEAFQAELSAAPGVEIEQAVCQCILGLARDLKPELAEVLHRTAIDEVAVRDYAEEAGITRGNAAVRAFRAREALKREVHRACGSCAAQGCRSCTCGE